MTYRPDPKELFKNSEITIGGVHQNPLIKNNDSSDSEKNMPESSDFFEGKSLPLKKLKPINFKKKVVQKERLLKKYDFNTSGLNANSCFLDKNFVLSNLSIMDSKKINRYKPLYTKNNNNDLMFTPKSEEKIRFNTNDTQKINFPKISRRSIDNKNLLLTENYDRNKDYYDMFTSIENNILNKSTKLIVNDVKILKKKNISEGDFGNIRKNFFVNTQIKMKITKNNRNRCLDKNELNKIIEKERITLYEKNKKFIDKGKIFDYNSHWNGNVINLKDDKLYKNIKKFEILVNKIRNSNNGCIVDLSN